MKGQVIVKRDALDKMLKSIKPGEVVRILHDQTDYGVYQEFGTSKMAAQPFITPAMDAVRPTFIEGLKQIKNLEQLEMFVDKVAYDALAVAMDNVPVDTGYLKNSLKVSTPEEFK